MIPCTDCPPLWARFYTLEDNRPFFSDRDGVKKFDISEIGHERRNGYSWYNSDGLKVFKKYEQWKKKHNNDSFGAAYTAPIFSSYPNTHFVFFPKQRYAIATRSHETPNANTAAAGICKYNGTPAARINTTAGPVKK